MSFPVLIGLILFAVGFNYFFLKNEFGSVAAKKLMPQKSLIEVLPLVLIEPYLSTTRNISLAHEIFYLLFMIFLAANFASTIISWRGRGEVLLNLGKGNKITLLIAIIFVVIGTLMLVAFYPHSPTRSNEDILLGIFLILVGITVGLTGQLPTVVTEKGIFFGDMLRWERIENYLWTGPDQTQNCLFVTTTSRVPFMNFKALKIPPEHVDQVKKLLTLYTSVSTMKSWAE